MRVWQAAAAIGSVGLPEGTLELLKLVVLVEANLHARIRAFNRKHKTLVAGAAEVVPTLAAAAHAAAAHDPEWLLPSLAAVREGFSRMNSHKLVQRGWALGHRVEKTGGAKHERDASFQASRLPACLLACLLAK